MGLALFEVNILGRVQRAAYCVDRCALRRQQPALSESQPITTNSKLLMTCCFSDHRPVAHSQIALLE